MEIVGSIIGGFFGSNDSENAADAQVQGAQYALQAAREAEQFARERASVDDQRYEQQRGDYERRRAELDPYKISGATSLANLNYMMGIGPGGSTPSSGEMAPLLGMSQGSLLRPFTKDDFQASPAYQFNLEQGMDAINKQARRSGRAYAPSTLQDVAKFSQGYASGEFQNAQNNYRAWQNDIFNRLSGQAGSGQNATVGLGGFSGQAGNSAGAVGNALNAQGDAYINAGDARASGIVGGGNALRGGLTDAYNNWMSSESSRNAQRPTYGNYEPPSDSDWQMEP